MIFWCTSFVVPSLRLTVKRDTTTDTTKPARNVCRVCSPCCSLIAWRRIISCAGLMETDDIVNQLVNQGVVSAAHRRFFFGFFDCLSSVVWVPAIPLAIVRHHWSLPSSLLVSCSCSHLLVESSRTCCVVGGMTWLV